MQAQGSKARDDLKQLQKGLTCDRLRPLVTAALDKANALPDATPPVQIKSAQQELTRVGCYSAAIDGSLSPTTTVAIQHYQAGPGKSVGAVDITDAFISDLKKQTGRVCPLVCQAGKIANGDTCVAEAKPETPVEKPTVAHHEEKAAPKKMAAKPAPAPAPRQQVEEAPRPAPQPHVIEQAASGGGGGGGHGTMIGVGFSTMAFGGNTEENGHGNHYYERLTPVHATRSLSRWRSRFIQRPASPSATMNNAPLARPTSFACVPPRISPSVDRIVACLKKERPN